jgi:ABC-type branched-subunit amino acid transport system substrate-binding protein
MEVVDVEFCDPAATDVSTELTRLSAYNPDWIFCSNLYGLFAATLKGAAALGMLDKVKIATATWNMDPIQTKLCGKELVEGIVGAEPYWQWSDDSPAMRTIKAEFERNNRTEEDIGYFYWHVFSHVCCSIKIAQQVIDKYGWEGFTGPHMLEVIESTESIDGYGIQTITLSGKKHSCRQARMYQFKNGEIVAIGDWGVTPDLRPAEYRK